MSVITINVNRLGHSVYKGCQVRLKKTQANEMPGLQEAYLKNKDTESKRMESYISGSF